MQATDYLEGDLFKGTPISEYEGRIRKVVINFAFDSSRTNELEGLKGLVRDLSKTMDVVVHGFKGMSPADFELDVLSLESELTSDEKIKRYFEWLPQVVGESNFNPPPSGEKSFNELSWEEFSASFLQEVSNADDNEKKLTDGGGLFQYLVNLGTQTIDYRRGLVEDFLKEFINDDKNSTNTIYTIASALEEGWEIRKKWFNCSDNQPVGYRKHQWIQDRILVTERDSKSVALGWCGPSGFVESSLICYTLKEHGHVDEFSSAPVCMEGANVMKADRLFVALDEVLFSLNACPKPGATEASIRRTVHEMFRDSEVEWFGFEPRLPSFIINNSRIIGRLGNEANLGLPFHHMDLFMNFSLEPGVSGELDKIAFVGKASSRYYKPDYRYGLDSIMLDELDNLNSRLFEVERFLVRMGFKIKNVPLIPIHGGRKIVGLVTYNNSLIECFYEDGQFKRRVYLSTFKIQKTDLNWDLINREVKAAYKDYEIVEAGTDFNPESLEGIRCRVKVLKRDNFNLES